MLRFCNPIWIWRTCWFHMILFLSFHSQVKLFYRLRKLQKRLLTELLIFCSNFVLGPFILLWFFNNLILIFCLLCNEYVLFFLLCMFNFRFFFCWFCYGFMVRFKICCNWFCYGLMCCWIHKSDSSDFSYPPFDLQMFFAIRLRFSAIWFVIWV